MNDSKNSQPSSSLTKSPFLVGNTSCPVGQVPRGIYFVGQTNPLTFGKGTSAWSALFNPSDSETVLFGDAFTVTNLTEQPFLAQFWINALPVDKGRISRSVFPGLSALPPFPVPNIILKYESSVAKPPKRGICFSEQIVAPFTSLVDDEERNVVFLPGSSLAIILIPLEKEVEVTAKVSYGWWEKKNRTR